MGNSSWNTPYGDDAKNRYEKRSMNKGTTFRYNKVKEDVHTSTETPLDNSTGQSDYDNKD